MCVCLSKHWYLLVLPSLIPTLLFGPGGGGGGGGGVSHNFIYMKLFWG